MPTIYITQERQINLQRGCQTEIVSSRFCTERPQVGCYSHWQSDSLLQSIAFMLFYVTLCYFMRGIKVSRIQTMVCMTDMALQRKDTDYWIDQVLWE